MVIPCDIKWFKPLCKITFKYATSFLIRQKQFSKRLYVNHWLPVKTIAELSIECKNAHNHYYSVVTIAWKTMFPLMEIDFCDNLFVFRSFTTFHLILFYVIIPHHQKSIVWSSVLQKYMMNYSFPKCQLLQLITPLYSLPKRIS